MSAAVPGSAVQRIRGLLAGAGSGLLNAAASRASGWLADTFFRRYAEMPVGSGRALSDRAICIAPEKIFSPSRAALDGRTRFNEADRDNIEHVSDERLFYRGIPYSRYLGAWAFHPGRIGGYLTATKLSHRVIRAAKNLPKYMTELPNGGLALYYPSEIRTTRFLTREPLYSGIAQGQLLAAYTRLIQEAPGRGGKVNWRDIAARLALSLQFPFEQGGVAVNRQMILEAPNYRSCPESILNGWMDALIHLHDYTRVVKNPRAEEFYRRNLDALVELLPTFDDSEARLSRYSNLCPYLLRVRLGDRRPSAPNVRVEYLATKPGFSDYHIPELWPGAQASGCPYDNGISAGGASFFDVSVSISGQFDVRIQVEGRAENITFDPGTFNRSSTVPAHTLTRRSLLPAIPYNGHVTTFFIQPIKHRLMAGCPTNFMKRGRENFYHSYHIAALYELALTTEDRRQRQALTDYAQRWLSYMQDERHKVEGNRFVFTNPATFVRSLNTFRALRAPRTFQQLQASAADF